MSKGRWSYVVAVGVSAAVLASGLVAVTRKPGEEKVERARKLAPAPVSVSLNMLDTGGQVMMGRSTLVRVEAVGPALDEVALWEDGRRVDTFAPDAPLNGVGRTFEWLALRPGTHLLHATAHGSGGTAHSTSISINVAINSTTPTELPVLVSQSTTPEDFAKAHGIAASLVSVADDQTSVGGVPEGSTVLAVDAKGVAKAAAAEIEQSTVQSDGQNAGGESGSASDEKPGPTAPPELKVTRHDCALDITSPNASSSLSVYQSTSGTIGFEEVGTLESSKTLNLGAVGPGTYVFVAGPVGEPTSTTPVSIVVPQECIKTFWKGDASLVNGILTIAKPDSGDMWIYLSVDDDPAVRVPFDTLQTFRASTSRVNIRHLLPTLKGKKLRLEVWSYKAGQDKAAKIGSGDAELPDGMNPSMLLGESTATTLKIKPTKAKVKDTKIKGTWSTLSERVDKVMWQVTTQPVTQSNDSLFPLGTVAFGLAPASGSGPNGTGMSGSFEIPIDKVVKAEPTPLKLNTPSFGQVKDNKAVSEMPVVAKPIVDANGLVDLKAADQWLTSSAEIAGGLADGQPIIAGTTYYVRVVPLSGTTPVGGASQSLRFDGPTPTEPPEAAMSIASSNFSAGRAANPNLSACIRITDLPWSGYESGQFFSSFFPSIGTYCPGDWKVDDSCWAPDVLCDLWNAVVAGINFIAEIGAKIWDGIAMIYNGIIELAATLVAKLNPYCLSAAIASYGAKKLGADKSVKDVTKQASDLCEKIAKVAAKATISAVLVAFGLPPSLPTSGQLLAMAEGDLTEFAVAYLKELGVPCDDLVVDAQTAGSITWGVEQAGGEVPDGVSDGIDVCRDAVKAISGEIKKAIKQQAQTQIANATGLPLPFGPIDGFEFTMEPRGSYRPPSLTLTANARDADAPTNSICPVWAWATQVGFDSKKDKVPTFAPTQITLRRPFFSDKWVGWTSFAFNPLSGYGPQDYNLSAGSLVKAEASSSCTTGADKWTYLKLIEPMQGRWKPGESD
ncbi:MAG: hypothetical protein KDB26_11530 [Microthrixaceae bacterium]|nr:hypothetical protein [Microthrixaceae bacterium]